MATRLPLLGVGVLVTRPIDQAHQLAQLIAGAGGEAILFPALEILDAADLQPLYALIDRLNEFDFAIFISPTAVRKAMNLICARRELLPQLSIAAIGKGSRRELERCGVHQVITPPHQFDSEGLLALPEFQDMRGKRVVIFRGEGGREVLGNTLRERGAQVEYAESYRRGKPAVDAAPLLHRWARGEVHAVTVTSGESLHNLFEMLGRLGQQCLKKTPLFVPHPRIAELARSLGLEQIMVTAAGDEGLLMDLIAWQKHRIQ